MNKCHVRIINFRKRLCKNYPVEGVIEFKGKNMSKDGSGAFLWKLSGDLVLRRKTKWEEAGGHIHFHRCSRIIFSSVVPRLAASALDGNF